MSTEVAYLYQLYHLDMDFPKSHKQVKITSRSGVRGTYGAEIKTQSEVFVHRSRLLAEIAGKEAVSQYKQYKQIGTAQISENARASKVCV